MIRGGCMPFVIKTVALLALTTLAGCAMFRPSPSASDTAAGTTASTANGRTPEARNMELVGSHDLQARSAYQPVVREQNGRWILYVGHHGGTEKVAKPVNALTGQ